MESLRLKFSLHLKDKNKQTNSQTKKGPERGQILLKSLQIDPVFSDLFDLFPTLEMNSIKFTNGEIQKRFSNSFQIQHQEVRCNSNL